METQKEDKIDMIKENKDGYKIIKRRYCEFIGSIEKTGYFICIGEWADKHLAYSRVDENGNVIDGEDGRYVQVRSYNGYLFMLGI